MAITIQLPSLKPTTKYQNISLLLSRKLRIITKKFKLLRRSDIALPHLIGHRISVKWSQLGNKWFEGMIVLHEGKGRFWVRYDADPNGGDDPYYNEGLLTARPPQWKYVTVTKSLEDEPLS